MPIFKQIYTNPTRNKLPKEFVIFREDCNLMPLPSYIKIEIKSSDEVDYSGIDGDTVSWLIIKARESNYNGEDFSFVSTLSDAERFLYESFKISSI